VLGAVTDPYQPIERRLMITRQVLEVLHACHHPVAVTTKSALVLRDLDLLGAMAADRCAAVQISIATPDADLARRLEPHAAAPKRRLEAVRALAQAGISTGVLVSPLIPGLTDQDLERVLEAAAQAGASRASSLLIRLPLELKDLFTDWLQTHFPERAGKVLGLIRQCRGGKLNDARFGTRFTGMGPIAELLQQHFELVAGRLDLLRQDAGWELDSKRFRAPGPAGTQGSLFDSESGCLPLTTNRK